MKKGKIMTIIALVIVVGLGYFKGMGIYSTSKKVDLGVKESTLMLCGDKPNCVSTTNTNEIHTISPIETPHQLEEIINKLQAEGFKLIKTEGNYAHLIFSSKIMGFVDDLEIMLNDNILSINSASRVGYSDMGKNRERVEKIRIILK